MADTSLKVTWIAQCVMFVTPEDYSHMPATRRIALDLRQKLLSLLQSELDPMTKSHAGLLKALLSKTLDG